MPSHLTRVVFRSIIANRPLLCRRCLLRPSRLRPLVQCGVRALPSSHRRPFFSMFKPQRKIKSADLTPGLDTMGMLAYMQRDGSRLPPPSEVAQALNRFFAQEDAKFEDFHVQLAHNAFQYLQAHLKDDGQPWVAGKALGQMLVKLVTHRPQTGGRPHLAFGRAIYAEAIKQTVNEDTEEEGARQWSRDLTLFVQLLSEFGAGLEARDLVLTRCGEPYNAALHPDMRVWRIPIWITLLEAFAREDNKDELLKTVKIMRDLGFPFVSRMQMTLVRYFAEKKDVEQAKHWFSQPVVSNVVHEERGPSRATYIAFLKACARCGDHSSGQQVVASLLKTRPSKESWDAIFLWSAAIGKGVDEIERMMNVMVRRNTEDRQKNSSVAAIYPDIDTINTLVEYAMSKQDSYSAERLVSLGEKLGISPNEKTFTMQIQYRLSINDLDGARAAYFGLQGNMSGDDESVAVVNCLIQSLCKAKQHHFDDIMAIVDDLHERKARLAPQTVATLCLLHLRRGETPDAMDLIQVHAHHFSPEQRSVVRKSLAAFILDGETSTADAWDTYQILRNTFPETPRTDRISIMKEFFARKRSDMACHVFFHMRDHMDETIQADKDVYVAAFTGFARNADAESLELAHNQLKLDMNVEMDTQIRNSLMLAYAGTGNNRRALAFWAEIGASKEGPTYNSIAIALRSCEGMPFGDRHAKSIWHRLKQMDVDIDKVIFTAYLGAIARNQLHDEAVALVESAEEEYGFPPDLYILGNWFNATANIERQGKVEEWIRRRYPAVWTELEALGHWVTMDGFGYRQYNLNRDLDP